MWIIFAKLRIPSLEPIREAMASSKQAGETNNTNRNEERTQERANS